MSRGDRGSGTVAVLGAFVVVVMVISAAALVGAVLIQVSQVRHAADLAAMAGARTALEGGDACRAARLTARENGTRLTDCQLTQGVFDVVVAVEASADLSWRRLRALGPIVQRAEAGTVS